jgi:hypothetical protein
MSKGVVVDPRVPIPERRRPDETAEAGCAEHRSFVSSGGRCRQDAEGLWTDPGDFFRRFPEGIYEIEGVTRGGTEFGKKVKLSHVLAAPPSNILLNGVFPAAESCDVDPLPSVSGPVTITWDPVTTSHPEIGKAGPVKIARYQFFVEQGDVTFGVDLPPTVTEFQVPTAITAPGGLFKFEIIARTTARNNTAVESCFVVE